jgi:hypothetical protein
VKPSPAMPMEFKRAYRTIASLVLIFIPWWFVLMFIAEHPVSRFGKIFLSALWLLETWVLIKWWVFEGKD